MAVQVYQKSRRRTNSGFPWGIALVGIGAYLYWEHQRSAAATQPSQTGPAVLPPATSPAALPVSSSTQATLQQSPAASPLAGTADYHTVYSWALREGQPQIFTWLDTIGADDLAKFAYVTQMWTDRTQCVNQQCFDYWHYIKLKYPTVFAYKTYW